MSTVMTETEYRDLLTSLFRRIESAFEDVDPDLVECSSQFGALTLSFADGSRLILSAQPSVRQLWMAVASQGVAHHFNFDPARRQWWDDKGKGLEFEACFKTAVKTQTGLQLELK